MTQLRISGKTSMLLAPFVTKTRERHAARFIPGKVLDLICAFHKWRPW